MTKKPARKPAKRGPKEERLIITEDPSAVLKRLLTTPTPKKPRKS